MFRQSLSRNQRSRGVKVKHILQIFVLLAIAVWLVYQIKNSQNEKKEFGSSAKISEKVDSENDIIKLGRKDLYPRVEESASETQRQIDEETEELFHKAEEEVENKPEETEEEVENKPEVTEEEGRGGGDDEIDQHNQKRAEEEAGHTEDSFSGEKKDREESKNEKERQNDDTGSSEDQDHDGGHMTIQEAREENYKGDDASSAVVRDTPVEDLGGMKEHVENVGNNKLEQENKSHKIEEVTANKNDSGPKTGEDEKIDVNRSANATATEEKMGEHEKVDVNPSANATSTEEKITKDEKVKDNTSANATATDERGTKGTLTESEVGSTSNSTKDIGKTPSSSLQNGTETITNPTQPKNASLASRRPNGGENNLKTDILEQINSNTTDGMEKSETSTNVAPNKENSDVASGEPTDSSGNSNNVVPEVEAMEPNITAGAEDKSGSLTTNEKSDKTIGIEKSKDGSTSSSMKNQEENANETQHDVSDSSILQEIKEARADLGTLPETKSEGMDHDE